MALKNRLGCGWDERVGILCSMVFLVIANIPGTIALRYGLQLVLLLLVLCYRRDAVSRLWSESRWPAIWLVGFVGYAALHCWLIAYWPAYAWSEFRSQLVVGALWFFLGWGIYRRPNRISQIDQLIIAGSLLALAEFLIEAWHWKQSGTWPYMVTFTTDTHLEFTFFMNIVLAFVMIALFFRQTHYIQPSRLPVWLLSAIGLLAVFVSVKVAARNGMIGLIYLGFSITVIYMVFELKRQGIRRIVALGSVVVIILCGLGAYSFKADTRNEVLLPSLQAGWNYQTSTIWLDNSEVPFLPDGRQMDDSAYKRIAWFHSGFDLIAEHPQGYGFGRDAFGLALLHKGYPHYPSTNAHSGIIDLGIRLGLPGIVLWFGYCLALVVTGLRAYSVRGELRGLVLLLVSCGFMGRMMIESIQRDHMLFLFLFITAGLLAEISARRDAFST